MCHHFRNAKKGNGVDARGKNRLDKTDITDHKIVPNIIVRQSTEQKSQLYISIVDHEKAFD
jgi:hypothetical protein